MKRPPAEIICAMISEKGFIEYDSFFVMFLISFVSMFRSKACNLEIFLYVSSSTSIGNKNAPINRVSHRIFFCERDTAVSGFNSTYVENAIGACSPDEPQPKFFPATMKSPSFTLDGKSGF